MKFNFLVVLVTIVGFLLPKEINFILVTLVIIAIAHRNVSIISRALRTLWPITLLLLLGIVSAFDNTLNDVGRDLFLVLKIFTFFVAGAILSKFLHEIYYVAKCLKIIAILSAIQHIFYFIQNIALLGSLDSFRLAVGRSSFPEMLLVAIIFSGIFNKNLRKHIGKYNTSDKVIYLTVFLSFILYFSRTMILSALIISLFLINLINIRNFFQASNGRIALIISFTFLLVVFLIGISGSIETSGTQSGTLLSKFENIPNELFWSSDKTARASLGEINANWRGYESYQGLLKFYNGSELELVFGQGWGTLVNLGLTIQFAGSEFTEIPVLHNGYVTLLLKTGVLGLILYVVFIYTLGAKKIPKLKIHSETYYVYQMLSALSVITLLNTFTTAGLLSVADIITPLLLGLLWAIPSRAKRRIQNLKPVAFSYN